jgi:hypothetical protein
VLTLTASQPDPTAQRTTEPMVQRVSQSVIGTLDRNSYKLTFASADVAHLAARYFPPLGDGMPTETPAGSQLQTQRNWTGNPVWTVTSAAPVVKSKSRHHR